MHKEFIIEHRESNIIYNIYILNMTRIDDILFTSCGRHYEIKHR